MEIGFLDTRPYRALLNDSTIRKSVRLSFEEFLGLTQFAHHVCRRCALHPSVLSVALDIIDVPARCDKIYNQAAFS